MVRARQTSADDSDVEDVSKTKTEAVEEGSAAGSEAEDEEEYEIEEIVNHSIGEFGPGKLGYLVKWKGYPTDQNSWVPEEDANAQELIEAYWKRVGGRPSSTAKKPRKSDTKPKTSAAQKRKSSPIAMDIDSDGEPAPAKKRGRPSKASISEDDEPPKKPTKATKATTKTTNGSASAASKRSRAPVSDEEDDKPYENMTKYKNAASWDHLVHHIETVERAPSGGLKVYFVLNNKDGGEGALCCEPSTICKQKMPQKMLDFYENNLSWRRSD